MAEWSLRQCALLYSVMMFKFPFLDATITYTRLDICREITLTSRDTLYVIDFNYDPFEYEYNSTYECRTTFSTLLASSYIVLQFLTPTKLSETGSCENKIDIVFPTSGTTDKRCTSVSYAEIETQQNIALNFRSDGITEAYFKVMLYTFRRGLCQRGDIRCVNNRCVSKDVLCELEDDVCGNEKYHCPSKAAYYAVSVVVSQLLIVFCVVICCLCRSRQGNSDLNRSNRAANQTDDDLNHANYFAPPPAYESLVHLEVSRFIAQSSSGEVKFTFESRELFGSEPPPSYDKLNNDYRQTTHL